MNKTALLACVTAAVLTVTTGCRSGVVATRSVPPAPTTSEAAAAPAGTAAVGSGDGGAGTVTLAVTEPVQASGHAATSVACTTGRAYVATATSATIDGYRLSFTVRVARYHGPGTYPALVTLRLDGAAGAVTTLSGVPNINTDLTDTSGSFTIDTTGTNGRTLAASLTWTCD